MLRTSFLVSLRASLLAAVSLGAGACGDDDDGGAVAPGGGGASGGGEAGGGAGAPAGGAGGAAGGGASGACKSPVPVATESGSPTGFERCADGAIRRVAVVAADPAAGLKACAGTEDSILCRSDAECTERPHGTCASSTGFGFGGPTTSCGCVYPCANDAECGAGRACVASGVVTPGDVAGAICAPAACVTGGDCPSGECGLSVYNSGCGTEVRLACRSEADACRADATCAGASCALAGPGATSWQCAQPSCAIGRPLLVDGAARTTRSAERADWATAEGPGARAEGLAPAVREALARHWLDVAALEHASVASFARFTLELLALGAPPALVAGAQRAGLDEVAHAASAYALASAYAGRRLGPGPLDLSGVAVETDRRRVVRALVHEACVGETLGAAEARAVAEAAADPAFARAYARVAADEQRHAELAWRTLGWLLADADGATLRFAARCFDEAVAAAASDPPARACVAPEHGLLSAAELGALRRRVLRDVVVPCAASLCGRGAA